MKSLKEPKSWRHILLDITGSFLSVCNLVTGYGKREVLTGVSVEVPLGRVVAIIGHNGAGKSTLLRAIFGLLPIWGGQVAINSETLLLPNPSDMLRRGVSYIPQGNRVFTDLTLLENLQVAGTTLPKRELREKGIERALSLFPILRTKLYQRAGTLSGGEQQMVALCSALVLSPSLLLLDEPSLGLAPQLISQSLNFIKKISFNSDVAVLIVEQKVREVLRIADYVVVLRNGRVSFKGLPTDLRDEQKLRDVYL